MSSDSLDRFLAAVRAKCTAGAREYGGASFALTDTELREEIQHELEDVVGWGFVRWIASMRRDGFAMPEPLQYLDDYLREHATGRDYAAWRLWRELDEEGA